MADNSNEIEFRIKSDYTKQGRVLALSYATFLASGLFLSDDPMKTATNIAIIAGVFASLKIPYVRKIPMMLSTIFYETVMARKREKPSQALLDDVEELRKKAGIKHPINTKIHHKGLTDNAFVVGNNIYIGSDLDKDLGDDEMKCVLAHEISHIKTEDIVYISLSKIPFVNSILVGSFFVRTAFNMATNDSSKLSESLVLGAIGLGYYKYQSMLKNTFSRIIEERADRNAVKLNPDLPSHLNRCIKTNPSFATKQVSLWERLNSSHPEGVDRLRNIEKAHRGDDKTPMVDELIRNDNSPC